MQLPLPLARWCQSWEIPQARPEEIPVPTRTPEEIAALALRTGRSAPRQHLFRADGPCGVRPRPDRRGAQGGS